MNNDKNQNNRGEKNDKYAQQLNSREIDHAYYAHPETCRNQWFNYSDPYTSDDRQVENYQKQTAQNEKINSNNVFNPSQNNGSTTDYSRTDPMHGKLDVNRDAFENTAPVEPFVDAESHINYNTAPRFAGDHQYTAGNTDKDYVSSDICDCGNDCGCGSDCGCDETNACSDECDCGQTKNQNKQNQKSACGCQDNSEDKHDYTR